MDDGGAFTARMLVEAGIGPGMRVLDVGCGPATSTIDLGTIFRVDEAGVMTSDAGRVVIGPGRPCLSCWWHIDPHAIRIESLAASDREALIRDGCIEGEHEAQPSVIAFNTFVVAAGAMEFMRLVTSFGRTQSSPNRIAFSFSFGTVKRNTLAASGDCRICGGAGTQAHLDEAA